MNRLVVCLLFAFIGLTLLSNPQIRCSLKLLVTSHLSSKSYVLPANFLFGVLLRINVSCSYILFTFLMEIKAKFYTFTDFKHDCVINEMQTLRMHNTFLIISTSCSLCEYSNANSISFSNTSKISVLSCSLSILNCCKIS